MPFYHLYCLYVILSTLLTQFHSSAGSSSNSFKSLIDWRFQSRSTNYNIFKPEIASRILLVSLVDGTFLAVDIDKGDVIWSINEEDSYFLSFRVSDSANVNGKKYAYIPSSSGDLYKIDENMAEFVPYDDKGRIALDNNFYVSSSTQESITIGLDGFTGTLYYYCDAHSCFKNSSEGFFPHSSRKNLLVMKRVMTKTQIIDATTGTEFLRFESGKHQLFTIDSHKNLSEVNLTDEEMFPDRSRLHYDINSNILYGNPKFNIAGNSFESDIRCWKIHLSSPIISSWISYRTSSSISLKKVKLSTLMSIHIDGLYSFNEYKISSRNTLAKGASKPCCEYLFLNVFNGIPFLQSLDGSFQENNCEFSKIFSYRKTDSLMVKENSLDVSKRIFTPQELVEEVEKITNVRCKLHHHNTESSQVHSLKFPTSWKENSLRRYIRSNHSKIDAKNQDKNSSDDLPVVPFIYFWRELVYVGFVVYLILLFIIRVIRFFLEGRNYFAKILKSKPVTCVDQIMITPPVESDSSLDSSSTHGSYNRLNTSRGVSFETQGARFIGDFNMVERIGTGGFGVVFKGRHGVDDCLYAIKRVTLPDCLSAREKVMREVKALAKLNHSGIIRFYNAWFEDVPTLDENHIKEFERENDQSSSKENSNNFTDMFDPISARRCLETVSRNSSSSLCSKKTIEDNIFNDDVSIEFVSDSDNVPPVMSLWGNNDMTSLSSSLEGSSPSYRSPSEELIASCHSGDDCSHSKKIFLYIQMELCHKQTLRTWLFKHRDDRSFIKSFAVYYQILYAIEFVHSQGLMHRDLKPSNIFFSFDGLVKIGDFGLVNKIGSPLATMENNTYAISSHSHFPTKNEDFGEDYTKMVGTELYMSPEQLSSQSYNYKIDIYSLGLIFFELLVPFSTQQERQKLMTKSKVWRFPRDLVKLRSDYCDLLRWMLQPDPTRRPSAADIINSELFKDLVKENVNGTPSLFEVRLP